MLKGLTNTFFGSSIFIFVTRFFPLLANTLVIIFFSRHLDAATYGSYQNFWIQLYLLNPIACLGIHVFILTYTPAQLSCLWQRMRGKYLYALLGWILLLAGIFAFFRYYDGQTGAVIPFLFLTVYALSLITESLLIAFRKFGLLAFVSLSYAGIYLLLHWQFLQQVIGINELFTWLCGLIAIKLLVYAVAVYGNFKRVAPSQEPDNMQNIRSLWMHLGLYDVSQMMFRWVDKFIISLLLTERLSAIYFNGSIDIPFISVILGAVGSAALMRMADRKSNDVTHTLFVSQYSSRILSAVVFPLFFFFFFFAEDLFVVLLSQRYAASVSVFLVAILTMPLYAYHLTAILQNRHKGRIINLGALLDLVIALALMYPFYLIFGLPGVALSVVVSSYIQAGFYLYHTAQELNVKVVELLPMANWLLKLIVFFVAFISIHYLLKLYFPQQFALILGGVFAIVVCIISLFIELKISKRKYGHELTRS